jgi:hypothetical protein
LFPSDFLLLVLKDLMVNRPDMKIILMSATLNANLFSEYFYNCNTIHIPGRAWHREAPGECARAHTTQTRATPRRSLLILPLFSSRPHLPRGPVLPRGRHRQNPVNKENILLIPPL